MDRGASVQGTKLPRPASSTQLNIWTSWPYAKDSHSVTGPASWMQNKWSLLFKLPTTHPGERCTCTDSYTHTIAMCTCRRAYVYTDLPTMYMYMHTDAHVYAQTHLHTIQSQTQRHMSVCVCTDPPSHYTKTLKRHPFRAPHRQQTHTGD